MAELQLPLKKEIETLVNRSNEEFSKNRYAESIKLLEIVWDKIPNPKGLYNESYHIVKDIIETFFVIKNFNKAEEWVEKLFLTGFMRIDAGEKEFFAGKIAYELENFDIAREFFIIANKKSEGRCFEGEDEKYLKFLKIKS